MCAWGIGRGGCNGYRGVHAGRWSDVEMSCWMIDGVLSGSRRRACRRGWLGGWMVDG
jgi:hypothetical protein